MKTSLLQGMLLLSLCLSYVIISAQEQSFCVTAQTLNFRSAPDTRSGYIIDQLSYGKEVELLEVVDYRWVQVRVDGQTGYLSWKYLDACPESSNHSSSETKQSASTAYQPAGGSQAPVRGREPSVSRQANTAAVLVCMGRSAYAYHSGWCRGLNNCRSEVYEVSRARAESMGRTPCGYCY